MRVLGVGVALLLSAVVARAEVSSAQIAFVANLDGNWDIFIADPDGKNVVQLTRTPHDENEPRWSPDRKKIVCSASDGKLYVIEVETRQIEEVAEEDASPQKTGPCFSPDGTKIVYSRVNGKTPDDTDLAIFDLEAKTGATLIRQYGPQFDPDWSPDGKYIVYTSTHCSADGGRVIQELWLAGSQGGYARQILMTNSHCVKPRWSADGKKIVFASDKAGGFDIWALSAEDWSLRQLTADPGLETSPAWSPDGSKLAFVVAKAGRMQIQVKNLVTGKLTGVKPFKNEKVECRDVAW